MPRSKVEQAAATGARAARAALSHLTTPLLPDDYLHLVNPLWTARELRGEIVSVTPEGPGTATLTIKPGWGWRSTYEAGQYVGIGVQVDGKWHWRSYSLTSVPDESAETFTVTVKATPEGFLSKHLVEGVEPGTLVRLAAPGGDFTVPDPPPEKVLLLTAGSGITPVMAILRTLDRRGTMPDVVHVHSAPSAEETTFREELHHLAEKHERFRLHEQHTRTMGKLDLSDLGQVCPDWRERETWACGPNKMLEAAEELWRREHLTGRLHVERFTVDLAGAGGEGGTVTFGASGRETQADGATSLLEAGEAIGVLLPYGCRMGICQSCVVPLTAGNVRDLRSGEVKTAGDKVQTCISAAAGDCVLGV